MTCPYEAALEKRTGRGTALGRLASRAMHIAVVDGILSADDIVALDDRAARLEARSRGVPVTGLLGLVVHGAQQGKITRVEAKATLDALAQTNFRTSSDLYRWALGQIGA